MTTKKTQKELYAEIREILVKENKDELVAFVDSRVAQIEKKSTGERKPTARQIENETYKGDILDWMEKGKTYSAGDVAKGVPSIVAANLSVSRVAPMLSQLAEAQKLVRTEDKRKSYYTLA